MDETIRTPTLRLSGAVLFRADFCAPWDVSSPDSGGIAEMLMPGAGRLVLFHVITGGECWAEVEGEPRVNLREGDVVVFPYGDAHVMGLRFRNPCTEPSVSRDTLRDCPGPKPTSCPGPSEETEPTL
jgi:hypothetical protein